MRRLTPPTALVAAVLLASCVDEANTPTNPFGDVPSDLLTPSLSILDANNGEDGNEHFFWLKPIYDAKKFDGVADGELYPSVVICERVDLGGGVYDCDENEPALVTYTRDSGADKDRIEVDDKDQYFVHWRMNDYTPQRDGQYRIKVIIGGSEVGHADVIAMRNREIRAFTVNPEDEMIPVSDRGSFKIAFRLEEGVLESQFCDFDGDEDVADCSADQEIAGDGIDTQIQVSEEIGGDEVVAVITAPDGVFEDVNGNVIQNVVITAEVELLPPSYDVFTDDNLELPYFVEVNTYPSDVYIDPNGPGVDVIVCQDDDELDNRGITDPLHGQLILYKVGDNGVTRRLVSTPVACSAPAPAPAQGFAGLLRRGADHLLGLVRPQPLVARRRLHGGLNTKVSRDESLDEAFSTFGAALGPNADSSEVIVPLTGDVGTPLPITIQLRNALNETFLLGGDTLEVEVIGGANTGTVAAVVDNGSGLYSAEYTPTNAGIDSITVNLIRNDGVGLGLIRDSIYTVAISGPLNVVNTNDSGVGSLRQMMSFANAVPGEDTIRFAIPGPGPYVISLATALPDITEAVVIDGTSQTGYAGTPLVEVNGAAVVPSGFIGHGFSIQTSDVTIQGMAIAQNPLSGIFVLEGTTDVTIADNYIGTDAAGAAGKGNARNGVILRSSNSFVTGNVISGNGRRGIVVQNGATNDTISGNIIGLDPAGTTAMPNVRDGIGVWNGAANLTILNNTVTGNDWNGIQVLLLGAPVTGVQIVGNTIGLDTNGDLLNRGGGDVIDDSSVNWGPYNRGNLQTGIRVVDAPGTIIGAPGQGNVISGNTQNGVEIVGNAAGVLVQANYIGTDASGGTFLGNGTSSDNGVTVSSSGASGAVIGGTGTGEGNVISGNLSDGIGILGATDGVTVMGNLIGTDPTGSSAIGNGTVFTTPDVQGCCHSGILVESATNVVIGGTAPGAGNVVSGNNTGLWIGAAPGIQIVGNLIGTNAANTGFIPNTGDAGIALYGTQNAVVQDNVISGNQGLGGIFISDANYGPPANNLIQGNTFNGNTSAAIVGLGITTGQTFRSNSMAGNALGIDLGWDGPTANDVGDGDSGVNNLQNYPVITSAQDNGSGGVDVAVSIDSNPSTSFTLELFTSATCSSSGFGEGATSVHVGATPTTDGAGTASYLVTVSGASVGDILTGTLTHPDGSTSEFSACATVAPAPPPAVPTTGTVWYWSPASGGNGHYYEYVTGSQSWTAAKAAAEGVSYLGETGHLVTITSAAEQAFVNSIRTDSIGTLALPDWRPWIGLSDAASEGNFQWVTGEPVTYTNWSSGEPNNASGIEHYVEMFASGVWNDIPNSAIPPFGYLVEYDVAAPPPPFTIDSTLPLQAAAGFGQMITVDGTGFPGSPTVQFTQGSTTLNGFVYAATGSRLVVRLPTSGLSSTGPGVPTDVTVTDGVGTSNTVTIPVSTTPGTPLIIELLEAPWTPAAPFPADVCGGAQSVSDGILTLDASGALAVRAHGFDTSAAQLQIVQGINTWTLNPGCATGAPSAHIVPLPALGAPGDSGGSLATGAAQVRVRTQVNGVWSAWSTAVSVTLNN